MKKLTTIETDVLHVFKSVDAIKVAHTVDYMSGHCITHSRYNCGKPHKSYDYDRHRPHNKVIHLSINAIADGLPYSIKAIYSAYHSNITLIIAYRRNIAEFTMDVPYRVNRKHLLGIFTKFNEECAMAMAVEHVLIS